MSEDIEIIIRWWEKLSDEDMNRLMGTYRWEGTIEERHKHLREFREKWLASCAVGEESVSEGVKMIGISSTMPVSFTPPKSEAEDDMK